MTRSATKARALRPVVVALSLAASACTPAPTPQEMIARCKLEAVRITHNDDPDDNEQSSYVETCMEAAGYELSYANGMCLGLPGAPLHFYCYRRQRGAT